MRCLLVTTSWPGLRPVPSHRTTKIVNVKRVQNLKQFTYIYIYTYCHWLSTQVSTKKLRRKLLVLGSRDCPGFVYGTHCLRWGQWQGYPVDCRWLEIFPSWYRAMISRVNFFDQSGNNFQCPARSSCHPLIPHIEKHSIAVDQASCQSHWWSLVFDINSIFKVS